MIWMLWTPLCIIQSVDISAEKLSSFVTRNDIIFELSDAPANSLHLYLFLWIYLTGVANSVHPNATR